MELKLISFYTEQVYCITEDIRMELIKEFEIHPDKRSINLLWDITETYLEYCYSL